MPYRLECDQDIPAEIKRIGVEQIDRAQEDLDKEGTDKGVHQVRKRLKKIRGLLRLVRDEVGQDYYKSENLYFRDLDRLLAPARDALSDLVTLQNVSNYFDDQLRESAFVAFKEELQSRADEKRESVEDGELLEEVRTRLTEGRERIEKWPIASEGFAPLAPGLERVYRRGRKGYKKCLKKRAAERIHDWRKRVKYLWYHHRILQPLWPEVFKTWAHRCHHLSDLIGDAHDMAELTEISQDFEFSSESRQALLGLLNSRRTHLETRALDLGGRIYAEKTSHFLRRLEQYWTLWRSDS